jgi:hypothetical protein
MRRLIKSLFSMLLAVMASQSQADLVVVASAKSGIEKLGRQDVVYLFMGRLRQLPGGQPVVPLDLAADIPERMDFYRQLVNKEPAEIKAYWSRLVFAGGSRPPLVAESREELIRLIGSTPGAIGYIDRSKVDARLRIIHELSPQN